MILNQAFLKVFYKFLSNENIKIICQIHDSILFQVRKGHEHLVAELEGEMVFPVTITGADGVTRQMTVPAEVSSGGHRWSDTK
jgi:DNA polymerase I-like protein with 3'-5' exonuclease and polymerase domains